MKTRHYQSLLILFILAIFIPGVHAQQGAMLTVDMFSGTVDTGDPCPVERDSLLYRTIQDAVDCAQAGDYIAVGAGTYFENILVDKNPTFQGIGTASTIIDGGMAGRVFTVNDNLTVTFVDLTITGGEFDSGAGIYT